MSQPILYYSNNCKHCISLWGQLKQKNLLDSIKKINVNKTSYIPPSITEVPSLIISGRPVLVGDSIMMYFNTVQQGQSQPRQTQMASKSTQQLPKENSCSIEDYMPTEMSGNWSDQYSYLENPENPINHSFSFLTNTEMSKPMESNVNVQKTDRRSELDTRLELLKQQRGAM